MMTQAHPDVGLRILESPTPPYTDQIRSHPCTFCGNPAHSTWQNADNGFVIYLCHSCFKTPPRHKRKYIKFRKFKIPKIGNRAQRSIMDTIGLTMIAISAGMIALPLGLLAGGIGVFVLNWRMNE